MTDQERIVHLATKIADLRARLPRHSTPVAMLIQLEELEEELARLRARTADDTTRPDDI